MENVTTISRPYARAIYELAHSAQEPEQALKFWELVLYTAKQAMLSETGQQILQQSTKYQAPCKQFVQAVLGNELCTQEVNNFLDTLEHFARFAYIPGIFNQFERIRQENNELPTPVKVIISQQLNSKEEALQLGKAIADKLGHKVNLSFQVDESLLSGIIIKTDKFTIDCSGRKYLEELKASLAK